MYYLCHRYVFCYIGLVTTVFYNPVRNCLKSGGYNKSGGLLQPRKKQYAPIQ